MHVLSLCGFCSTGVMGARNPNHKCVCASCGSQWFGSQYRNFLVEKDMCWNQLLAILVWEAEMQCPYFSLLKVVISKLCKLSWIKLCKSLGGDKILDLLKLVSCIKNSSKLLMRLSVLMLRILWIKSHLHCQMQDATSRCFQFFARWRFLLLTYILKRLWSMIWTMQDRYHC